MKKNSVRHFSVKGMISAIITAVLLTALLAGSVSAAEPVLDGSWPEEPIKIGVEVYDTTDQTVLGYQSYFDYLSQYYNVQFMFSESIADAEQELQFVDACAAAGCKGFISGYNISKETQIKRVTDMGMYYWGVDRDLDEEFTDNSYYLGGFLPVVDGSDVEGNGDFLLGYELAYSLASGGSSHAAFCNGGADFGIQMFIDRQEGFFAGIEAAQADGFEIAFDPAQDVVSGFPGTDEFAARQSQVINGDYDAVAASFSGVEVWLQPIIDAGKMGMVKLAGVGAVTDAMVSISESGSIGALIYECEEVVFGNAIPMIINAVNGHADMVKGEEGYAAVPVNRWTLKDPADIASIYEKHEAGEYYVTAEDIAQLLPELNPEATREDMMNFYRGVTLEAALAE